MSSPLQFYRKFKALLAEHDIRAVLTSGMACVEYGIQQTTKDTDWIIHPDDLEKLVALLCQQEKGLTGSNWRISYRGLFGAPIETDYLRFGWTSHLAIHDEPLSPEHHVDIFGQPPRLTVEAAFEGAAHGLASPLVVAQMKKTDRDKDWPMVELLGEQMAARADIRWILHSRDGERLSTAWLLLPDSAKAPLLARRPLLLELEQSAFGLRKCLAVERAVWEEVNKLRYRKFQSEWREFLRRWRADDAFAWPVSTPFVQQQKLVSDAARKYSLPREPLGGQEGRRNIVEQAILALAEIFGDDPALYQRVVPPMEELLP